MRVVVVGGGVFGLSGALELRARGVDVVVVESGPAIPRDGAESTDISKVVRIEYGSDEQYTAWMELALERWRDWNRRWTEEGGRPLFHECGVLFVSRETMRKGSFEHDSYETLTRRGHRLERMDAASVRARFPAWDRWSFLDGYYNPIGGWVESAHVVSALERRARASGVVFARGTASTLVTRGSRTRGICDSSGTSIEGDAVVVAAGSWSSDLVPWLSESFRYAGQPVFHLAPQTPALFEAHHFPVFGADIATTGYYGFPLHEGVVKIANHGPGRAVHPDGEREVPPNEEAALRQFVEDTFGDLARARVVARRTCIYADTKDEHFWIAADPDREGLVVATGGSGHAFKFAPLLGTWIADATLGDKENGAPARFRWRPERSTRSGEEQARCREP